MKLRIIEVQGPDDNTDKVEKIFFTAQAGINLKDYLLYDNTFTDDERLSNKGRHIYRFPNFVIEKPCRLVLWVAKGPRLGKETTINKNKSHRFYWGRSSPIINNTGDKLTLAKVEDEQLFEVAPS